MDKSTVPPHRCPGLVDVKESQQPRRAIFYLFQRSARVFLLSLSPLSTQSGSRANGTKPLVFPSSSHPHGGAERTARLSERINARQISLSLGASPHSTCTAMAYARDLRFVPTAIEIALSVFTFHTALNTNVNGTKLQNFATFHLQEVTLYLNSSLLVTQHTILLLSWEWSRNTFLAPQM